MKSIRKWGVSRLVPILCISSVVVAAVVACTGSDPAPAGPIAPGELGGDCFVNSTCNPGLVCTTIDGNAKCANPSNTSSTSSSSSSSSGSSGIIEAGPDAPVRCVFQPTSFVCKELARCYGEPLDAGSDADAEAPAGEDAGPDCVAKQTACDPGQLRWECNSGHYCATNTCCITAPVAVGNGTCGESKLQVDDAGSVCAAACAPGTTKLCQVNEDCAEDELCRPARVFGPSSIQGTIVGACIAARK